MCTEVAMAEKWSTREEFFKADLELLISNFNENESPTNRDFHFAILSIAFAIQAKDGKINPTIDDIIQCLGEPDGMYGTINEGCISYLFHSAYEHDQAEMDYVAEFDILKGKIVQYSNYEAKGGCTGDFDYGETPRWDYEKFCKVNN